MKNTKEILEDIIPIYEYNYEQIKINKILYSIITRFNSSRRKLEEAAKEDEKEFKFKVKIDEINKIIQEFYQKELIMQQEKVNKKQMDGWGNIGVIYNGMPEITIALAILALRTHNNIVFFIDEMKRMNHLLIQIIQDAIEECNYTNCIYEVEGFKEDLVTYQSFFDMGIVVGDKYEYQRMKTKIEIPLLYNGYGNVIVYSDDVYFKELLADMDKYAYYNNINLHYFYKNKIQEDIRRINEININDCVAIFTKDSKKAYNFIEMTKANRVYVNINPFLEYKFEFEEEDLILKKQIKIKE